MHAMLLLQLQQTLTRLCAQPIPIYKVADQLGLRIMISSSIRQLRELYAFTPTDLQDDFLLRRANLLEQESQVLASTNKVHLGTWNLLYTYLKQTIEAALEKQEAQRPPLT